MRTIARGSMKMLKVKEEFTVCRRYDDISGELVPADAETAWNQLATRDRARLVEFDGGDNYTIRISPDHFYKMTRPAT
jgi:hypothetical protein